MCLIGIAWLYVHMNTNNPSLFLWWALITYIIGKSRVASHCDPDNPFKKYTPPVGVFIIAYHRGSVCFEWKHPFCVRCIYNLEFIAHRKVTYSSETSHKCQKVIFQIVDVENSELVSSKMMYHLSYLAKISLMKNQYFSWKFLCFLLVCGMFIGLYPKTGSSDFRWVLW